jgi:hypothetical protein
MADFQPQNKVQEKMVEYLEREAREAEFNRMRYEAHNLAYDNLAKRVKRTCFNCGEYFYRDENYEAHVATCGKAPDGGTTQ